ncbi:L-ribulose-5-phosphate 3-epimerase UlaE [Candidatus Calditenuaceae archaeon HR02]|nr:L-ribulose-5-phosphate 3-epimerase UlaE [Candidatus Calditenuaceae archaeon HR02]
MRIGLNAWTVGGWRLNLPTGLEGVIEVASALGYDGVEIVYDDSDYKPDKISKKDRRLLLELALSHDISIPSIATGVFWRYSLASHDEAERITALTLLKMGVELAADLESETLLVVPAVAKPGTGYKETYNHALSSIVKASRWAEDHGVKIGLENVWSRFLYDPIIFRRFIEDVGSDAVGLYFDVGNVLELAPFEHWLEVLGDRIVMVHAKDYDMNSRGPGGFRLIGRGSVDWGGFVKSLKSLGYDGFINVETPPEFMKSPNTLIFPQDGIEAASISLQKLREYMS